MIRYNSKTKKWIAEVLKEGKRRRKHFRKWTDAQWWIWTTEENNNENQQKMD